MKLLTRTHAKYTEGTQTIYRFKNNYGASVVKTPCSYGGDDGLFELAVIKFDSHDADDWHIDYEAPITDDVIGNLSENKVTEILEKIEELK